MNGRIVRERGVHAGVRSSEQVAPRHEEEIEMPKASKQTASEHETVEGYEGHFEHFDGGWTVGFETYTQDADLAPFQGASQRSVPVRAHGLRDQGEACLSLGGRRGDVRGR
jgi:hypothetical protein